MSAAKSNAGNFGAYSNAPQKHCVINMAVPIWMQHPVCLAYAFRCMTFKREKCYFEHVWKFSNQLENIHAVCVGGTFQLLLNNHKNWTNEEWHCSAFLQSNRCFEYITQFHWLNVHNFPTMTIFFVRLNYPSAASKAWPVHPEDAVMKSPLAMSMVRVHTVHICCGKWCSKLLNINQESLPKFWLFRCCVSHPNFGCLFPPPSVSEAHGLRMCWRLINQIRHVWANSEPTNRQSWTVLYPISRIKQHQPMASDSTNHFLSRCPTTLNNEVLHTRATRNNQNCAEPTTPIEARRCQNNKCHHQTRVGKNNNENKRQVAAARFHQTQQTK